MSEDKYLSKEEVQAVLNSLERKFKKDIEEVQAMIVKDVKTFGFVTSSTEEYKKKLTEKILAEEKNYEN